MQTGKETELAEKTEKLNLAAMNIIMGAGDARNFISKAIEAIENNDFAAAQKNRGHAQDHFAAAHGQQTEIIQRTLEGETYPASLLFNHAQDTLMTVGTELNLVKQFQGILKNMNNRITNLEEEKRNK